MVTLTISPLRFQDDPAESSKSREQEVLYTMKVALFLLDYSRKGILDLVLYFKHGSDLKEPSVCVDIAIIFSLLCFLTLTRR